MSQGSNEVDRRVLLAERDVARAERMAAQAEASTAALRADLAQSAAETAVERARAVALENELSHLYQSSSWRWSAPVRQASLATQRIRAALGGPAPGAPHATRPAPVPEPEPAPMLSPREHAILQRLLGGMGTQKCGC